MPPLRSVNAPRIRNNVHVEHIMFINIIINYIIGVVIRTKFCLVVTLHVTA